MGQTTRRSQGSKDSSIQELGPHLEAVLCRQAHARNENDLRHYVRSGFIPPFLVSLPFGCLFFFFLCFFLATKLLCCCFMLIVKDFSAESTKHAMMYGTTHVVHFAPWSGKRRRCSPPHPPLRPIHCGQRHPHKTIKSSGKCRGWVVTTHPAHPAP